MKMITNHFWKINIFFSANQNVFLYTVAFLFFFKYQLRCISHMATSPFFFSPKKRNYWNVDALMLGALQNIFLFKFQILI